jgi:hypothetical protein
MTKSYELPDEVELDDEILLALEGFISQEETIIEGDKERKQKLEDDIFVNKMEFSEQVTKKIVRLMDELDLDEDSFAKFDDMETSKIDEEYRFHLSSEITLFSLTQSGLYKQVFLLGGTEEFFPYSVSVDANTNQVIVRMRPLFATIGKFFDFFLPFEDDKPSAGKHHVVEMEVKAFISELFTLEYNRLTLKIRQLTDEYNRECEYVAIKNNYQDKGLEVW